MRRLIAAIGFQIYAVVLAFFQYGVGVRTDEAKYLLNIPYPHPPLARFILSAAEALPFHELFWRIMFATFVIQSVWLLLDTVSTTSMRVRTAVASAWLLSAAVMFQAGTVMMAPLTAVQGVLFVWLYLRGRDNTLMVWLIGLLWLASLFTAYQAALYGPLVLHVVWRTSASRFAKMLIIGAPVALLALYTFINPLALASMLNVAAKDATQTVLFRLIETGIVLLLGGSIVLSIVGTALLFSKRTLGLSVSFLLVLFYVLLGRYDYYAIFFTPLLMGGLLRYIDRAWIQKTLFIGMPMGLVCMFLIRPPQITPSYARDVLQSIDLSSVMELPIHGPFGHEWQYESTVPVRRYLPSDRDVRIVLCVSNCAYIEEEAGLRKRSLRGIDVFTR